MNRKPAHRCARAIALATVVAIVGVLVPVVLTATPAFALPAGTVYTANDNGNNVSQFSVGATGLLSPMLPATAPAQQSPQHVAVSPDGKSVYVTNANGGSVTQYDVAPSGALTPKSPASVAAGHFPSGLAISPDGTNAYVVNDNDGTISQYDIGAGGLLSAKTPATVAIGPKSHQSFGPIITVSPDGTSVYVTSFLEAKIYEFNIGAGGALAPKSPASVATDTGPIGVAASPDGTSVYVAAFNKVDQYTVGAGGQLSAKSPASVAAGTFPFAVAVSPDNSSVYVTDTIDSNVRQYSAGAGGALTPKSPATVATGAQPSGIVIAPDGSSAWVANTQSNSISQYTIGATGALTAKTPATVTAAGGPSGIAVRPAPPTHPTSTAVQCAPASVSATHATTCTATVTDTASPGATTPTGTVGFTTNGSGAFGTGGACTLAQISTGVAACAVTYTPNLTTANLVRTDLISGFYSADDAHGPSNGTANVQVLSATLLASGSFVVGDRSATPGAKVTYWSSRWWKVNKLSDGTAPASFKGFASRTPNNPPQCGDTWTTSTGGSSNPPHTVPEYMVVAVASRVAQSGLTILGNVVHVVIVHTKPGHDIERDDDTGSGTVVATIC
jgi:DNA-binding beta-propeller fold protein YncE